MDWPPATRAAAGVALRAGAEQRHSVLEGSASGQRGGHKGLSLLRPSRLPAPAAGVAVVGIDSGAVDPQLVSAGQRPHGGGVAEGDRPGHPEDSARTSQCCGRAGGDRFTEVSGRLAEVEVASAEAQVRGPGRGSAPGAGGRVQAFGDLAGRRGWKLAAAGGHEHRGARRVAEKCEVAGDGLHGPAADAVSLGEGLGGGAGPGGRGALDAGRVWCPKCELLEGAGPLRWWG